MRAQPPVPCPTRTTLRCVRKTQHSATSATSATSAPSGFDFELPFLRLFGEIFSFLRDSVQVRAAPLCALWFKSYFRLSPRLCASAVIYTLFACLTLLRAATVDRVAVVVGNQVITQSEVEEEVRVTAFENQEPLDLSAPKRREAAERLVDQQLIRNEMKLEGVQPPPDTDGPQLLESFLRQHHESQSQLEASLRKYVITQQQFEHHLLWQAAAVRFVDFRFRGPAIGSPSVEGANRTQPGATPTPGTDDAQLDSWLKDARSQTRIQFKNEAFQ